MDSGIINKVGSLTPGDFFVGVSQKICCLREEYGFAENNNFGLGQIEFEILGDIQVKILSGLS